ncbi:MAG: DNA mismatch repair protein MutS [candidate division WOR-3 bacterium]
MTTLTPLLSQYHKIKEKYKDCLLLFRLGDFYEMFYDDAKIASQVLGLTLTARSYGESQKIPLAGIPVKSLDNYLRRLVEKGYKVAICEQLEEASPSRNLILRDVVEVITPGTIVSPSLLEEKKNNFLLAIAPDEDETLGIAYCDISTGEFATALLKKEDLWEEIQRIDPKEIIHPQSLTLEEIKIAKTPLPDYYFSLDFAENEIKGFFGILSLTPFNLEEKRGCISASGAILYYLRETQKGWVRNIKKITFYEGDEYLILDKATRRNLELTERLLDGKTEGSLLWALDETQTPLGARLLRKWLLFPLRDERRIKERQNLVRKFYQSPYLLNSLLESLRNIGDIERIGTRVAQERANARELLNLAKWLREAKTIKENLQTEIPELASLIPDFSETVSLIENTLLPDPPLSLTEGDLIKEGVNKDLDELRDLSLRTKDYLMKMEEEERKKTNIPNLRIGYNSVFGYYIEVTKSYTKYVPKNYSRKQTLTNCERFITLELKELERKILSAEERRKRLEYEIFADLRKRVSERREEIFQFARVCAEIDCYANFAAIAQKYNYTCPEVFSGEGIYIKEGRHPVVERLTPSPFIPNDTNLTPEERMMIITGPNMSGKSTYLRQVALIVIMAQMGSFVPAREAKIGIVDKIFTRIGASDDLSRGVSTFLAEMQETANILNNATPKSLVILDEVGRGTATYDGLAIAWATCEYLYKNPRLRPKTLFATHYHELTDITEYLKGVKNYHFLVKETEEGMIFLRKLTAGKSSRSYGIEVAKLAGLPEEVIRRAREVLRDLEKGEEVSLKGISPFPSLPEEDPKEREILKELKEKDIDRLTPLEALLLLAEWKKRLNK